MEFTVLQVLGCLLVCVGAYSFYKNEIQWSVEVGPGSTRRGVFHFDLTPDRFKYRKEGVMRGKWVRPTSALVVVAGLLLMFVFTGDTVAFSL